MWTNKTVTATAPGTTYTVEYDTLIVAAGASQSYFGNDGFAEFAPGMKSIDDALELRGRIFGAFELAELETDPAAIERWLTFVVVGAGATGVEMAGQIAELAHRTLPGQYRRIDPQQSRIILVDALDAVLPTFGDHLSTQALRQLHKLGVEVELGDQGGRRRLHRHRGGDEERPAAHRVDDQDVGGRGGRARRSSAPARRRPPGRRPTGPAGSRSTRTARCPATRRSSPSAT